MSSDPRPRILHVVGDSAFGGGSRIILRLAHAATESGYDVAILATDPIFAAEICRQGISLVDLDCIWRSIRPWRDIRGLAQLTRYFKENRPAIVHTHTSKAGFVGRVAASHAAVPVILHTAHGFAFHQTSPRWQRIVYATAERYAARHCHRIVTVSHFHRRWAIQFGLAPYGKLLAIPNGIAPAPILDATTIESVRQEFSVPRNALMIVSAGRLVPGKGLPDLIGAVGMLQRGLQRSIHLVLPGEGILRRNLQRMVADRGLQGHVLFPGFRSDVRAIVAAADIVALPSEREGLSLALLEAMAAGRPTVASSIGSNVEVSTALGTEPAVLLVPPGDTPALTAALRKLARDEKLARNLGARALATYHTHYTERRMVEQYLALYAELARFGSTAAAVRA
jgi:glycosyltransferase involved in cell wall biosynthesis